MYVFDVNGNSDTVTVSVTVEDNISPQVYTLQSLIIGLDSFGSYDLEPAEIDSGSWDSCGIDTMTLSQSVFTCADIGSAISVTLTATDVNGNSSTGITVITVIDTIAPQVFSINDTVYLDSAGVVSIDPTNVDSGSWDSCGIATYSIDTSSFGCGNTDTSVQVVLTVTDIYGNSSTDISYVTILDTIRPVIVCQADTVIPNDSAQCGAVVSFSAPSVADNCLIDTIFQSGDTTYQSGDQFPIGTTEVQFTVIDVNGNLDSCSFNVTVLDTQAPVIACYNDTLICDSIYSFNIPSVLENCPDDSIVQIAGIASDAFYPVGVTVNTFVATDASGNTDTCSFEVTRIDYPDQADAGRDTALCEVQSIDLYAASTSVGIGSWTSLGAGLVADTLNPNSATSGLVIGDNLFIWTVRNDVCVPTVDTINIKVDEAPSTIELPTDVSLCEESDLVIIDDSVEIGSAIWNINSEVLVLDSASDTLTISNLAVGDLLVYRINENGVCPASSDSMLVHNNQNPTVDLGDDLERFAGMSVTLSPIVFNAVSYSWSPANLFTDPTVQDAEVSSVETTILSLMVTSDSGCSAVDSLFYFVNGLDSIPTGITPNGDGINDVWNIPGLSAYTNAEVYVVDQSGREVFYSKGYDVPWDGRFNGEQLPRASYYWIIDLKDGINKPLKGIISIIR